MQINQLLCWDRTWADLMEMRSNVGGLKIECNCDLIETEQVENIEFINDIKYETLN